MSRDRHDIPDNKIPVAIRRTAAEWLALREARGFTPQEHADFAEWLNADPRRRAAVAEIAADWKRLDGLAAFPHSPDAAPDPDLLLCPRRKVHRWTPGTVGTTLAAAAALAIAVAWWQWPSPEAMQKANVAVAAQGTPQARTLADGSSVDMNADSELSEHFTPTERRVRLLRGEAHFTVTPNPSRPFVVEAGGVTLRALGTAFNVRLDRYAVDVVVTHGRVKVSPTGNGSDADTLAPILEAQQQITIPRRTNAPVLEVKTLAAPDVQQALAWQHSRIVFEDMPLAEVIARFNRARRAENALHLTIADPRLGALRFSGRLRVDDMDGLLEVLELSFGVTSRRTAGEIVLVAR